jgi:hypothetical protein
MAFRPGRWFGVLLLCVVIPATARASVPTSLDAGYGLMYSFDFVGAGRQFREWSDGHPGDPLGPVSQAANLLVSELSRLGILEAQFFANDASFTKDRHLVPDPSAHSQFEASLAEATRLAHAHLQRDVGDRDALFAMALVSGLRADYIALVEQRRMASLSYTREGVRWAHRVIAVAPDCADARLAMGVSDYIVGSLTAPLRWVLRLGGYSGNKSTGIEQVRFVAEHGRLLAPLARILLSIAYLREGDRAKAAETLADLCRDFPGNPLFAREWRRLNRGGL